MAYMFQFFIAVFSPSITLRLFGEVVLPGGGEFYAVSKDDGAYVLRSRFITEREHQRLLEQTGMDLRTCVTCSVRRPGYVNTDRIIERLLYRTDYEVSHDFLLLENGEHIIMMRKDLKAVINESVKDRIDTDFYYGPHSFQQLPKINITEKIPNGNCMDSRN